ncbi:hypothetical protein PR003_g16218 [Phytophthora rubi]|uniref:Uncharacterized protein n=1 Tax=Phytophthora rubi TaxID=129364 RepID=A0A6A3KX32_9STRA|nr:hypothetical protein PR002_g16008 [Phytophthora rubi]KAE9326536.1 hypothetical protein PR003_g16218 [Phytophthora rubi]
MPRVHSTGIAPAGALLSSMLPLGGSVNSGNDSQISSLLGALATGCTGAAHLLSTMVPQYFTLPLAHNACRDAVRRVVHAWPFRKCRVRSFQSCRCSVCCTVSIRGASFADLAFGSDRMPSICSSGSCTFYRQHLELRSKLTELVG